MDVATALRTVSPTRRRYALLGALVVVVALRGIWAWHIATSQPDAILSPDSASYVESAHSLIESGEFNESPTSVVPMYFRTPGYPAFLAALYSIRDSDRFVSAVQAVLSGGVIVLAYLVGRRLRDELTGVIAAVFIAVDPLQFAASGTLLTEMLSSVTLLLVVLAAHAAVTSAEPPRPRHAALVGVALAVATLVRPTTYYLPIVVAALGILWCRRNGLRRVGGGLAALMLPIALLIGGWQVRNNQRVESWRFSGIEALNLYCYRGAAVDADSRGMSIREARFDLGCDEPWLDGADRCPEDWTCPLDPLEPRGPYYDDMASAGIALLLDNPVETVEMTVGGFVRMMFGPGSDEVARYLGTDSSRPLTVLQGAWNLALVVTAAIGMVLALRVKGSLRPWVVFVVVVVAYYAVVSSGAESYSRFRTPIVPILAVFAAAPVAQMLHRRTESREGA